MNGEIALLLMSHGDFAKEAIKSAELVFGCQDNYETMSVFLVDQIDELRKEMYDKVERLDTSKGLLVFTDIVGGTPMNLACGLLGRANTMICSGLNLPLLIEALTNRQNDISNMKEVLENAYQMGMVIRTEIESREDEEDDLL